MSNRDADFDKKMAKIDREVKAISGRMSDATPSFTVKVTDPMGWDAIPCCLFLRLHKHYFPKCDIVVSRVDGGGDGIMGDIFSLMMLAAANGTGLKIQCDTDPKTFGLIERSVRQLFKRTDKPSYGDTYKECSEILEACKGKDPEILIKTLTMSALRDGRVRIVS